MTSRSLPDSMLHSKLLSTRMKMVPQSLSIIQMSIDNYITIKERFRERKNQRIIKQYRDKKSTECIIRKRKRNKRVSSSRRQSLLRESRHTMRRANSMKNHGFSKEYLTLKMNQKIKRKRLMRKKSRDRNFKIATINWKAKLNKWKENMRKDCQRSRING